MRVLLLSCTEFTLKLEVTYNVPVFQLTQNSNGYWAQYQSQCANCHQNYSCNMSSAIQDKEEHKKSSIQEKKRKPGETQYSSV